MTPHFDTEHATIWHGDCIEVMRELPDCSVDAVVTDPPYNLTAGKKGGSGEASVNLDSPYGRARITTGTGGFMGKGWDDYDNYTREDGSPGSFQHWCEDWAREALRVLKPGGHLLAFGGTRTFHRLTAGIEDAGFEIRDSIAWMYGSGFPKSLDVSKAIDKMAGAEREIIGHQPIGRAAGHMRHGGENARPWQEAAIAEGHGGTITGAPATPDAARWEGWGTALKPAFEPIVVARKPLAGTVAQTVLEYGTAALNIGASRIGTTPEDVEIQRKRSGGVMGALKGNSIYGDGARNPAGNPAGRWPSNVVLDESQAAALDAQSGPTGSWSGQSRAAGEEGAGMFGKRVEGNHYGDFGGGASRFFKVVAPNPPFMYTAKAPGHERPKVTVEGGGNGRVTGLGGKVRQCNVCGTRAIESGAGSPSCGHEDYFWAEPTTATADTVSHPTVKPLDLMRWLVKLVTPPGGTVLEPFAGSGTTVEACVLEGFRCIAIEQEADYLPLIMQRISKPHAVSLFGDWEDEDVS